MSPNFQRIALQRAARIFDLGVLILTFLAAFAISSGSFSWPSFEQVLVLRIKLVNVFLFGGYLLLCSAVLARCGLYQSHRLSHWTRKLREILLATTIITVVIGALQVPFQLEFATDKFLLIFWLLSCVNLLLSHAIGQKLLYSFRLRGRNLRSVVIVGESVDATLLAERMENEPTLGYRVVRIIDVKKESTNDRVAGGM